MTSGPATAVLLVGANDRDAAIAHEALGPHAVGGPFSIEVSPSIDAAVQRLLDDDVDVVMVRVDGADNTALMTLQALKVRAGEVPVLAWVAHGAPQVRAQLMDAGAAEVVQHGDLLPQFIGRYLSLILDRAQANQQLHNERLNSFRKLIQQSADGVVIVDGHGIIQFVNPAAANMFEESAANLVGRHFGFPMVTGERTEIQLLQRGRRTLVAELRCVDIEWGGRPAQLASMRDVTARREMEDALRREQTRANSLLAATDRAGLGVAVLAVTPDGALNAKFLNASAAKLLGLPTTGGEGLDIRAALGVEVSEYLLGAWDRGEDPEDPCRTTVAHPDGTELPLEFDATLGEYEDQRVLFAFMTDITERLEADEARREALRNRLEVERLRELDALKSHFLNTAAHELHTPMTPIKVQVELLRRSDMSQFTEDQRRAFASIDRSVDRLARLTQKVLEVARIQAGRLKVAARDVDLVPLVLAVRDEQAALVQEAGLQLHVHVVGPVRAKADPGRIQRVLASLVRNAVRFTPSGGRIDVQVRREGDRAVIEVTDTGVGLEPGEVETLFKPFSTGAKEAATAEVGPGLELYICRAAIEAHGGAITARSDGPGLGATFRVVLPTAGTAEHMSEA